MEDIQAKDLVFAYAPVYLGDALKYFFSDMIIEHNVNGTIIDIMDYFPILKNGYSLRSSIIYAFYQYIRKYDLQQTVRATIRGQVRNIPGIIPNQLFMESFNSEIPADFYIYKDTNDKKVRVLMNLAVEEGLIQEPLNTFEMIQQNYPEFNINGFPSHYIQTISSPNFYTKRNLENSPITQDLEDPQIIKRMIHEYSLLQDLSKVENSMLNNQGRRNQHTRFEIDDYFKLSILNNCPTLTLQFLNDDRIVITTDNNEDFINAIKFNNSHKVISKFLQFDVINPRYYGDKAFNFLTDEFNNLSNTVQDYEDNKYEYQRISDKYDSDDINNTNEIEGIVELVNNIDKYKKELSNMELNMKILKDAMFKRYWIEKEVYGSQMEPIRGKSTVPRDVMFHLRKMYKQ